MKKRAILMLAFGDRPWARLSFQSFLEKADLWEADAFLIREDISVGLDLSDLSDVPGRPNKKAYALKAYVPWHYMKQVGYESVLMVDDSCVVHPLAPNPFEVYPEACLGLTLTSDMHARESCDHINKYSHSSELSPVEYSPSLYGNTGVVLYRREIADLFSPERIMAAQSCLYSRLPHQTLFYYLHRRAGVDPVIMHKDWNRIPAIGKPAQERKGMGSVREYIDNRFKIVHFTGTFRRRYELIEDLIDYFRDIDEGSALIR